MILELGVVLLTRELNGKKSFARVIWPRQRRRFYSNVELSRVLVFRSSRCSEMFAEDFTERGVSSAWSSVVLLRRLSTMTVEKVPSFGVSFKSGCSIGSCRVVYKTKVGVALWKTIKEKRNGKWRWRLPAGVALTCRKTSLVWLVVPAFSF